jgi:hypothetical protein
LDSGLPDFLVRDTKTGQNLPNEHKIYQIVIKYPKCPYNIPNVHKIYQHFTILGPKKITQIGICGLKINHLATLFGLQIAQNYVLVNK